MDTFTALAEPTRRNILEFLANNGEVSATQIYDYVNSNSPVSPPAVSQHLKVLREAELVKVEKRAQQRIYTLQQTGLMELEGWIKKITKYWDERFEILDKILETEKKKGTKKVRSVKSNVKQ